ncbi:oligosaccharide flippase family protein [Blastococcus sp. SYSU D00820]
MTESTRPGLGRLLGQQALGRVASLSLAFAGVLVSSRYLGVEDFGRLSAALATVGLLSAFTDFGVNAVVVRRQAGGGSLDRLIATSLGLSLAILLPLSGVAVLLACLIYADDETARSLTLALIPYLVLSGVGSSLLPVFQVAEDFKGSAAAETVSAAVTLVGCALVAALSGPVLAFAICTDAAALARLAVLWATARKVSRIRVSGSVASWLSLLREASPLGLAMLIGILYLRLDMVLLSALSPPSQVGVYGLAYRLLGVAASIPNLVASSVLFRLSKTAVGGSRRELRLGVRDSLAITNRWMAPAVIGGAFVADRLMESVGGAEFRAGGVVLALLLASAGFTALNLTLGSVLIAIGRNKLLVTLGLTSLIPNVALNVVLIPHFGALAAAAVLAGTEALACGIAAWCCRGFLTVGVLANFLLLAPALGSMLFALHLGAALSVFLQVPIAGAVFLVVQWIVERVRHGRDGVADCGDRELSKS